MIKELRTYDTIVGLSDFDEYSYCEKDQMWYEDAKEVLPQPEKESEVVSDLICEIKVNHDASIWDEAEDWDKLEEDKDGLRLFAEFLFGDNIGWNCTDNAFLLKTTNQTFVTGLNDYGLWELESFTKKLKKQAYATEYSEYGGALKFIAWTNEDNQTRFVIHSYNENYEYLKTIFDITIDRNILVAKLENILKIWHDTVYNAVKEQERISGKKATNPHLEASVNHFFPEFRTPVNSVVESRLKYFEREYGIKILFAIENGSRAWKMASKNSDYDVRFVFKRNPEDYLAINKPKDVIETYLDEEYHNCKAEEALIDMVGFDIKKYIELLSKSNPTSIEWLMSDIIYYGSNDLPIKQYILDDFNPKTLIYHYVSLCKKHYNRYISENKKVTYKMYLYMMRGLLNALFVYKKGIVPPLDFTKTLELLKEDIPNDVYNKVNEIIEIKSSGLEKDTIERIEILDTFIEEYINKTFDVPEKHLDYEVLNNFMSGEIMKRDIPPKNSSKNHTRKPDIKKCSNAALIVLMVLLLLVFILAIFGF